MTGTPAQLNATLTGDATHPGLSYRGLANFFGGDQLLVRANDQGNFGSGGVLEAFGTVTITVRPVNDPPTAGSDSLSMAERHPTDPARPALTVAASVLTANDIPGPANEVTAARRSASCPSGFGTPSQGTVTYDGTQCDLHAASLLQRHGDVHVHHPTTATPASSRPSAR